MTWIAGNDARVSAFFKGTCKRDRTRHMRQRDGLCKKKNSFFIHVGDNSDCKARLVCVVTFVALRYSLI